MTGVLEEILAEAGAWPGVHTEPGRFGSVRLMVGRRELGHVHGSSHVDLPFPRRLRDDLIAAGRVERHHFVPDSGWATRTLREPAVDVPEALALLRLQYERATRSDGQATDEGPLPEEEG